MTLPAFADVEFAAQFVPPNGEVFHTLVLSQDTALSLVNTQLSAGAACGNTGFAIESADGRTDVVRSTFAPCDATEVRGPWALKAGTYRFKQWHNASGGAFYARLTLSEATVPNDAEPNDTAETALPLTLGQRVTGHLGYKSEVSLDSGDFYRFTLTEPGALSVGVSDDDTLRPGTRYLSVSNPDTGATINDLSAMQPGNYLLQLTADTYYAQAYGGYSLETLFTPSTPPVTSPNLGTVVSSNAGLSNTYVVLQTVFTPSQVDAANNTPLNLYHAAYFMGNFYFFVRLDDHQFDLRLYTGGEPPAYTTVAAQELLNRSWTLGLFDVSALVPPGFDLYTGFGQSLDDMLTRGQVVLSHSVR